MVLTDAVTQTINLYPVGFDPTLANLAVDATKIGGTTQTGRDLGASVLLSPGTGTGQISLTSGGVLVNSTASGAITATSIANNALGAAELAADAVTEIATAVATQLGVATSLDTQLAALAAYVDTEIAAIKAVTDLLPNAGALTSLATATNLATLATYVDTEVAAIKAKTDNLPDDPADQSTLAGLLDTLTTNVATLATYVDTEVAAIKAKTDNLSNDPADASDISGAFSTVNNTLATIAAYIDTEVAAIKAKTDNLPSDPADASVIATTTDAITAAIAALNNLDAEGIRTAIGLATANLDTQLAKSDLTSVVPDSVPADGSRPNVQQGIYMLVQLLTEFSISDAVITVKKPDGSTTLFTLGLDHATTPTGATRAS